MSDFANRPYRARAVTIRARALDQGEIVTSSSVGPVVAQVGDWLVAVGGSGHVVMQLGMFEALFEPVV
jgi:hypothetical protein